MLPATATVIHDFFMNIATLLYLGIVVSCIGYLAKEFYRFLKERKNNVR